MVFYIHFPKTGIIMCMLCLDFYYSNEIKLFQPLDIGSALLSVTFPFVPCPGKSVNSWQP